MYLRLVSVISFLGRSRRRLNRLASQLEYFISMTKYVRGISIVKSTARVIQVDCLSHPNLLSRYDAIAETAVACQFFHGAICGISNGLIEVPAFAYSSTDVKQTLTKVEHKP